LPEITNTFDVYGDSKTTIYLYPSVTSEEIKREIGSYGPWLSGSLFIDGASSGSQLNTSDEVDVCIGTDDGGNVLTEDFSIANGSSYDENIRFFIDTYGKEPLIVKIDSEGLFEFFSENKSTLGLVGGFTEEDYYDTENYLED
jgi:hypothetical protein